MTDVDRVRLLHMADASRKAVALVSGVSVAEYTAAENSTLRAATERIMEIVGQAAQRVSDDFKAQHTEIPWRQIDDLRNHLTPSLAPTDDKLVWKSATELAPSLLALLESVLSAEPAMDSTGGAAERGTSPRATVRQAEERGASPRATVRQAEERGASPRATVWRPRPGVERELDAERLRALTEGEIAPTREIVLAALYDVRSRLRSFGVRRIGVFGSVARNAARADSDIDILVDIPSGHMTADNLFGLQRFLQDYFQRKVDVVTESGLKPFARDLVMKDAVFLDGLQESEAKAEAEQSLSGA